MRKWMLFLMVGGILTGCTKSRMLENKDIRTFVMESELQSTVKEEECMICGEEKNTCDLIGLIHWNGQKIINIGGCGQWKDHMEKESTSTQVMGFGDGFGTAMIDMNDSRCVFQIAIDMTKDDTVDFSLLSETLCQKCLDKVVQFYREQKEFGAASNLPTTGYALIDLQTKEIYPVSDPYCQYYIRDYYVRYDRKEKNTDMPELNLEILYAPIR